MYSFFQDIKTINQANRFGFSALDLEQIENHGLEWKEIQNQLNFFKNGIPKTVLIEAAKINNGILKFSKEEFQQRVNLFNKHKLNLKLNKFVPASGAATRMFKFLNEFLNEFDIETDTINAYINRNKNYELFIFIMGIEKFPFFEMIYNKLKEEYKNFDSFSTDLKNYYFIKFMLSKEYFDFSNKPKGVLPFHKYKNIISTPVEEHLYECVNYSSSNGVSNLHFTITKEHQEQFEKVIEKIKNRVEKETNTKININYSYQKKSTDSIAVIETNEPFRTNDGKLLFRPGGHGALIKNLNQLDCDIVFIKNIDNIIPHQIEKCTFYKKALAGVLIELQNLVFGYLNLIDTNLIDEVKLQEIKLFLKERLNVQIVSNFEEFTFKDKVKTIKNALNKPIRVCGMVKSESEPGGGPFWIKESNGSISLQIVETSQIDLEDENQLKIMANATHFNPVDLVCGIKNYKNQKFNLTHFIDSNRGFIVYKNKDGKKIKSYELPGLWNGSMAGWLSIFIEVPLTTFNPVKTVNDLLKPAHQH